LYNNKADNNFSTVVGLAYLVPLVGIELTTYRLQGGCSTTELKRLEFF
jgi:hypothetical protein